MVTGPEDIACYIHHLSATLESYIEMDDVMTDRDKLCHVSFSYNALSFLCKELAEKFSDIQDSIPVA